MQTAGQRPDAVARWRLWLAVVCVMWGVAPTVLLADGEPASAVRDAPDRNYLIDRWEAEQGLPESSATAIVQTADGYLWFGTFDGLVRPFAGLMNLVVLASLTRQTTEEPWALEAFGPEGVNAIRSAAQAHEDDIWKIVRTRISSAQADELQAVIAQWRAEHPGERYVAGVRLEAFPQADPSSPSEIRLPNSVFGLLGMDPLAGLDPAVREIERSRLLAERGFFYARHASILMAWQVEGLYMKMLSAPEVKQALGNADRITQSTGEFATTGTQLAGTVERFRADLPTQQATLIAQLDDLIARQREGALTQAGTEIGIQRDAAVKQVGAEIGIQRDEALKQAAAAIAVERSAAIEQLNASVSQQQGLMAENLRRVMDGSIDRIFARARSLLLILAGGVVGVILIYCFIVSPLRKVVGRVLIKS